MNPDWAAEHLQIIRTLMERSALYRRALAPVSLYTGVVGLAAATAGELLHITAPAAFTTFWLGVSLLALCGAFWLVRRQALKDAEAFWSPPTRRVTQALLPPLAAGGLAGLFVIVSQPVDATQWLPALWMVLFGCALASAGFFMQRGIRLVGWIFILLGFVVLVGVWSQRGLALSPNCVMGAAFGGVHLLYGIYLRFTGKDGQ